MTNHTTSFSRTESTLSSLRMQSELTANDLLTLLRCAAEDVKGDKKVRELTVDSSDPKQMKGFIKNLLNLYEVLTGIYDANSTDISKTDAFLAEWLKSLHEGMVDRKAELDTIGAAIESAEQEAASLQAEYDQLEAQRGHLLTAKEQCDSLREKINVLNDPALDEMASEKKQLEAELSRREAIAAEQKQALCDIRAKLTDQENALTQCEADIRALTDSLRRCESDHRRTQEEKTRLEAEIASISAQVSELKEWLENFPRWSEDLRNEFSDLQNKAIILQNAWNSIWNNRFLTENLSSLPRESQARLLTDLTVPSNGFGNFEELKTWFGKVCTGVNDLTAQCETKLQALIAEAKKLTDPTPDQKN